MQGVNPMVLLSPAFYKQLFDVDTADVAARLRAAVYPFSTAHFLDLVGAKPDLYGPFWVAATLVFVVGAGANLASWGRFSSDPAVSLWKYDFKLVTLALACVYGWALGAPIVLWVALQWAGVSALGLTMLVCVYGYSIAVFVPAAVRVGEGAAGGRGGGTRAAAAGD